MGHHTNPLNEQSMETVKQLPPDKVNVSSQKPLKAFLALIISLLVILGAVYLFVGLVVDLAAPYVPWSWEQSWGDSLASQFADDKRSPEELKLQALLDRLTAGIAQPERKFTVHMVQDSTVNALALPGGHIVFFSGLAKLLDDPQEASFVLAHELGHYAHRDHLRGLGRGLVLLAITSFVFSDNATLESLFSQTWVGVESKFSQSQERDADRYAIRLMRCVYGSAQGAVELLSKLAARENASQLEYFFASHPHPQDRVDEAKKILAYRPDNPCP